MHRFISNSRKEVISSRNHPSIRLIRSLHLRAERERTGLFYIEGIRFVAQAIESRAPLEAIVCAPPLLKHPLGQRIVHQQRRAGVPCLEVTPDVLSSLALNDEPQGIGAVVRQKWEPLAPLVPAQDLCWLALETIQSPGNLGTMLRTSDAVGAAGVILIGNGIDAYDPATVRATMGAIFAQRFVRASLKTFMAWKHRHQCLLVGTSPHGATEYHAIAYPAPVVLFMGGERKGLSAEQQALCDVMVKIPMVGRSDSLNLAVATGIMLYEIYRQAAAPQPVESGA
ncbi:MAG: RNA methyltransferase [Abitibacteriaceae bacterium]|nr:RNA methyltransferase [Abditibacteriaceae bacterium]MBV9868640.1 RNA methyltransferase [Abditibacteriaceae bacterium]